MNCYRLRGFITLVLSVVAAKESTAEHLAVHHLSSARQKSPTIVRVLEPNNRQSEEACPTIYVLPVEANEQQRWGNSLEEVRRLELHNRFQVTFVFPTFSDLPWYADHPTDKKRQQESYLLHDVIPLVEDHHAVSKSPNGRLLVGFSKSGWGAFSLLMRHPDVFDRAAAFDAPMMMSAKGKYGSGPIFGTDDNFRRYQVSELLKTQHPGTRPRLALFGQGAFHSEHVRFEKLAAARKVLLHVNHGMPREHSWHSGWLTPAVAWLLSEQP